MKKFEIICLACITLAVVLKVNNIPGALILLVLSITTLSAFYQYLSFAFFNNIPLSQIFIKASYTGINALKIITTVFVGVILSLITITILFFVQTWPGLDFLKFLSLPLFIVAFFVCGLLYFFKKEKLYLKLLSRLVLFGAILLSFFIS